MTCMIRTAEAATRRWAIEVGTRISTTTKYHLARGPGLITLVHSLNSKKASTRKANLHHKVRARPLEQTTILTARNHLPPARKGSLSTQNSREEHSSSRAITQEAEQKRSKTKSIARFYLPLKTEEEEISAPTSVRKPSNDLRT